MNPIRKDELYENISEFLRNKGIELKEGSYTKGIHAGCSLLADAINLSQTGLERAKTGIEKKLDQVRQVIHEKTAPKSPASASAPKPPASERNGKPGTTKNAAKRRVKSKAKRKG
jgi:hypothetical protein